MRGVNQTYREAVWQIVFFLGPHDDCVSLNIINNSNQIVRMFHETAWRLTDPVFRKIRSFLPNFGGLDISPIIALLIIYFLRSLLREYWPMV